MGTEEYVHIQRQ